MKTKGDDVAEKTLHGIRFVVDDRLPADTAVMVPSLPINPGETAHQYRARCAASSVRLINIGPERQKAPEPKSEG